MITGAGRGIGFEIAKYLAGFNDIQIIALAGHREGLDKLMTACSGLNQSSTIYPMLFDLNDLQENPDSFIKKLPLKPDHLEILINNAGLLINKPFRETDPEEISHMFRINCFAPALLIRELLPYMGGEKTTHVVNISSMGGFQGSMKFPGLAYYSASKAALACLTECLTMEFKDSNIVFNCLALGSVQTDMFKKAFPEKQAQSKPDDMARFIGNFALYSHQYIRGKIIPVSITNP